MIKKSLLHEISYFGNGIIGGAYDGSFRTNLQVNQNSGLSGGSETCPSEQNRIKEAIQIVKRKLIKHQALDLEGYNNNKKEIFMDFQVHILESSYFFRTLCEVMENGDMSAEEVCIYFLSKLTSSMLDESSVIIQERFSGFAQIFEMILEQLTTNDELQFQENMPEEAFIHAGSRI